MVYRIFVEKKEELAHEAHALLEEVKGLLGLSKVERIRLLIEIQISPIRCFAQYGILGRVCF